MARAGLLPPPAGSVLAERARVERENGAAGRRRAAVVPGGFEVPPPGAVLPGLGPGGARVAKEHARRLARPRNQAAPIRGQEPAPWQDPTQHGGSALLAAVPPWRTAVPLTNGQNPWAATITAAPPSRPRKGYVPLGAPPDAPYRPIGVPGRHMLEGPGRLDALAPRPPLPGCVLGAAPAAPGVPPRRLARSGGGLGDGVVPRVVKDAALFAPPSQAVVPTWDLHGTRIKADLGSPGTSPFATYVDVYFAAGRRVNWGSLGERSGSVLPSWYRSCDDGNAFNGDLWHVRVQLGEGLSGARATRVLSDEEDNELQPIGFEMSAVHPTGSHVAVLRYAHETGNVFEATGSLEILALKRAPSDGTLTEPSTVAEPPMRRGGVAWPAWLGHVELLVGSEWQATPDGSDVEYSYASTWGQVVVQDYDRNMSPGRSPDVLRGPMAAYVEDGATAPDAAASQTYASVPTAKDPHAHGNGRYRGVPSGARIVTYGNLHDQSGPGLPRVFDYDDWDPYGERWEEATLPSEARPGSGFHHPTWNVTGDLFQASHQQGWVATASPYVFRRTLHGFSWDGARWAPFDGDQGRLFPRDVASQDAWYESLPTTLPLYSERLTDVLPEPVTSDDDAGPRARVYVWKYGHFCGTDDYVVAQFACTNEVWAQHEFNVSGLTAEQLATVGHFGQLISRVVLIRLKDGYHWDLTALVADELGITESATDHEANVFGIHPSCSPAMSATSRWAGGSTIHVGRRDD